MQIAVIAANGRLGRAFVKAALNAGHMVRAGVRSDHDFETHQNLNVVKCDATKIEDLREMLRDQEVVVSTIGHVRHSAPDVQTAATKAVVSVMNELGIQRFVDVTGTGVRLEGDKIPLIDRILNLGVGIVDPARVKDGKDHHDVLQQCSLDWTSIRVLKLQNVAMKPYRLTLHGPTKWYVGRSEVAQAMLEVIEQNSFVKEAPIISKP